MNGNEIPTWVYVAFGSMIAANIGTIVSVVYGVGKFVWWLSKLESRVEFVEKHHGKDIDEAHKAIRNLKPYLKEINQ